MEPIDTETVETTAGTYTIQWLYDEYSERPYDDGLGLAYDGHRERIDVADSDLAGDVLAILKTANEPTSYHSNGSPRFRYSSAGIARYLRIKYELSGIREVSYDYYTSEPTTDRGRVYGIAWAPGDAGNPDAYTDAAIAEYRAWAEGDVFGWRVIGPDGIPFDDCWGYYGFDANRDWTRDEAVSSIEADAAARGKKCALAGAGFVGLI